MAHDLIYTVLGYFPRTVYPRGMRVFISMDDKFPVYTVRETWDPVKDIKDPNDPDEPVCFAPYDLDIDAETLRRWEAAQEAWLQMQAEVAALEASARE